MTGPGSWSPLIDIDADRRQLELPDLLSYCKYEVTLSAYTVAGQGRAAVAVATTDTAGKCCSLSLLLLLLQPLYDPLSRTTQVSRYQKDKPFWILLKQT